MPRPHHVGFHRGAVELARLRKKPVAEIAEDLWISESCLRRPDGRRRWEVEILERASAFFAWRHRQANPAAGEARHP